MGSVISFFPAGSVTGLLRQLVRPVIRPYGVPAPRGLLENAMSALDPAFALVVVRRWTKSTIWSRVSWGTQSPAKRFRKKPVRAGTVSGGSQTVAYASGS